MEKLISINPFSSDHYPCTEASQLSHYEFIWLTNGEGMLTADMVDYPLKKNSIVRLSTGQVRALRLGANSTGYQLIVSTDLLLQASTRNDHELIRFISAVQKTLVVTIDDGDVAGILDVVQKMANYSAFNQQIHSRIIKALFSVFLVYVSGSLVNEKEQVQNGKFTELVERFMQSLSSNFTTRKQVIDYAAELCVTPGYLNVIVKKSTGYPVSYHIQQQVILEAKRQAFYSEKSMKEIAYYLGFESCAHFSKFFKNICGLNFTAYKKRVCA